MQDNLSYSEFLEWVDYLSRFPTHTERSEIQLAKQSQIIASQHSKESVSFYDFTLTYKDESRDKNDDSDNFYIDKKGRKIISSKNIDKILDKKFK